MMKLFLLFAGVFLLPVALTYGIDPAATLPTFMKSLVPRRCGEKRSRLGERFFRCGAQEQF